MADAFDEFDAAASSAEGSFQSAPSESANYNSEQIDWPGRYRVRVKSVRAKDGRVWPTLDKQDDGRWVYTIIYEQVDDAKGSAKGASFFSSLTVVAADNATQEKKDNTARFCKPQLCALAGDKNFALKDLKSYGLDVWGPAGEPQPRTKNRFQGEYMIDVSVNKKTPWKKDGVTPNLSVSRIEVATGTDHTIVADRNAGSSRSASAPAATTPAYEAGSVGAADASAGTGLVEDDLPF